MTSADRIRHLLEITHKAQAIINQASAMLWTELTSKPKAAPKKRAPKKKRKTPGQTV